VASWCGDLQLSRLSRHLSPDLGCASGPTAGLPVKANRALMAIAPPLDQSLLDVNAHRFKIAVTRLQKVSAEALREVPCCVFR
jgi:hypothetical protein